MRWLELSIEAPGEYAEPLTALFARHADGGVAVDQAGGYNPDEGEPGPEPDKPVTVRAYLRLDETTDHRRAQIDLGIRLVSYLHKLPPLEEKLLDEDDWQRQQFEPIRVGERLLISPPGSNSARRPGDVVIPLEPGLAFGTGHHPTTRMCLVFLERFVTPGARVLDVGCGSGILSIAALLLGAGSALGLDVDDDAINASRENIRKAGVQRRAALAKGSVPNEAASAGQFDLVLANISAKVLIERSTAMFDCLAPSGLFIGSGYMVDRQDAVESALRAAGGEIRERTVSGDWAAVVVERIGH